MAETLTGIETWEGDCFVARLKRDRMAETLTGIETPNFDHFVCCRYRDRMAETLTGIETEYRLVKDTGSAAIEWLKPLQGLKRP